jgi:[acyl-carrier-protein] S-malonyltransferase
VLDFAAGLPLVSRRGELMDQACQAADGAMAAVLGGDPEVVSRVCEAGGIDVANYNCPGQLVISGAAAAVDETVTALAAEGITKVIRLQVAGAFHSRLMQPAATAFAPVLDAVDFRSPVCRVVQNVTGDRVADPAEIRENLKAQVTGSVRWEACVRAMLAADVDRLIEVGPGKVLSGFMKRIDRRFPVAQAGTVADIEALAAKL